MTSRTSGPSVDARPEGDSERLADELVRVREALAGLYYGAVTIVVQDGVVVQIDRTEKIRFGRHARGS